MADDKSAGQALADLRKGLGWTQAKLAETLGLSTVLISKIEGGSRAPSQAFLENLASHVPKGSDAVTAAAQSEAAVDGRKKGNLKIVEALKLAKTNSERASTLKSQAEKLQQEANDAALELDAKVARFSANVVDPFAELIVRISEIPDEMRLPAESQPAQSRPELASTFREAQLSAGRSIFTLLGAGVLGGGAGGVVGAGAASATYLTVASIASASTGAAISSLSGAAATSATLAAIGGGSLAAGGLGIAGGTAMLTGIVAVPLVLVAAGAAVASGGRILEIQLKTATSIDVAQAAFEANEDVVRQFISRSKRITEILTVALLAVGNHMRKVEGKLPASTTTSWGDLGPATQNSIRRIAEITLACLTVLSLQIGLSLKRIGTADAAIDEREDEQASPTLSPELDPRSDVENEFIDYAIEESFGQVAQ